MQLPHPSDLRAKRVAEILIEDPSDARTLEQICKDCGASKRTVERLFFQQTAMTLGRWRQRFESSRPSRAGPRFKGHFGCPGRRLQLYKCLYSGVSQVNGIHAEAILRSDVEVSSRPTAILCHRRAECENELEKPKASKAKATKATKATKAAKSRKQAANSEARPGSKKAIVLKLLRRDQEATIAEIAKATD